MNLRRLFVRFHRIYALEAASLWIANTVLIC